MISQSETICLELISAIGRFIVIFPRVVCMHYRMHSFLPFITELWPRISKYFGLGHMYIVKFSKNKETFLISGTFPF